MTTRKQVAANKANAGKSTGPVSANGKAAVANNAMKHGLTTPPEWTHVTKWYRVITADPQAVPTFPTHNEEDRATIALAEAEACAERARQAEAEHLRKMSRPLTTPESIEAGAELDIEDIGTLNFLLSHKLDLYMRALVYMMKRVSPNRPSELKKTARRLTRYRREAEARRHKALNYWISMKRKNPDTKPNTT